GPAAAGLARFLLGAPLDHRLLERRIGDQPGRAPRDPRRGLERQVDHGDAVELLGAGHDEVAVVERRRADADAGLEVDEVLVAPAGGEPEARRAVVDLDLGDLVRDVVRPGLIRDLELRQRAVHLVGDRGDDLAGHRLRRWAEAGRRLAVLGARLD